MGFRLLTLYNIIGLAFLDLRLLAFYRFFFGEIPWVKILHFGLIFSGLILGLLLVFLYGGLWHRHGQE